MSRPLYIDSPRLAVDIDEGALRVSEPSAALRWYPLCRLSRVVSHCQARWETRALVACARAGVWVSFVDARGDVVARCIGQSRPHQGVVQVWRRFVERGDASVMYRQWYRSMERMVVMSAVRRMGGIVGDELMALAVEKALRDFAVARGRLETFEAIGQCLQASLNAWCGEFLGEAGFDLEKDCQGIVGIDLVRDFSTLLLWDFQPQRMAWVDGNGLGEGESFLRKSLVNTFEQRTLHTWKLARGLLNKLHRWLLET